MYYSFHRILKVSKGVIKNYLYTLAEGIMTSVSVCNAVKEQYLVQIL